MPKWKFGTRHSRLPFIYARGVINIGYYISPGDDDFYIQGTIKTVIAIIETARYYDVIYFARVFVKLINEKYKILNRMH